MFMSRANCAENAGQYTFLTESMTPNKEEGGVELVQYSLECQPHNRTPGKAYMAFKRKYSV